MEAAEVARLDQVYAACRDAAVRASPDVPQSYSRWLDEMLIGHGRAHGCPHHSIVQVLTVLRIGRAAMLVCDPCTGRIAELAGPSDRYKCSRCLCEYFRSPTDPLEISAAIGLIVIHTVLCVGCVSISA